MANKNPKLPPVKARFSKNNQPKNRGRKKSILRHLGELTGETFRVELTKEDKYRIIESLIEKSEIELAEIIKDKTRPIFVRSIATALQNEMKLKDLSITTIVLDRVHGRPKQVTESKIVNTGAVVVDTSKMTQQELEAYHRSLLNA